MSSGTASAQPAATPARLSNWELNLHAATLRPDLFDESAAALQFGGRLFRNFGSGLSIGANVDWAKANDVTLSPIAGVGATFLLYSAEIEYGVRVSPRAVFFVGAGFGAATVSLDDAPVGAAKSSTGTLIPAGGGIKIHNRGIDPSWALRFDVRDNVIMLDAPTTGGGVETEPRHNVEASVGLSFLFGGGSGGSRVEQPVAEPDSDRDGVPDPRDFCLNRPGAPVDARGCPLEPEPAPELQAEQQPPSEPEAAEPPLDADLDGVPDAEDGCLDTAFGVAVDATGCPVPVDAEPEPAPPGDQDGDGVTDDVDACPRTPAGIPIDARGCLARIEPTPETPEADDEAVPFPQPIEAVPEPEPAAPPEEAAACLEPSGERPIEFDGRRFQPAGFPQPVDRQFLIRIGSFDGITLYVSDTAREPYNDFWVPLCGEGGVYELYVEAGPLP